MKTLSIIALLVFGTMLSSFTNKPTDDGKVIIVITVEVSNYSNWKANFDAGQPIRSNAGIEVLSVCTDRSNQNLVTVIEQAESATAAEDFVQKIKSLNEKNGATSVIKEVKILSKMD